MTRYIFAFFITIILTTSAAASAEPAFYDLVPDPTGYNICGNGEIRARKENSEYNNIVKNFLRGEAVNTTFSIYYFPNDVVGRITSKDGEVVFRRENRSYAVDLTFYTLGHPNVMELFDAEDLDNLSACEIPFFLWRCLFQDGSWDMVNASREVRFWSKNYDVLGLVSFEEKDSHVTSATAYFFSSLGATDAQRKQPDYVPPSECRNVSPPSTFNYGDFRDGFPYSTYVSTASSELLGFDSSYAFDVYTTLTSVAKFPAGTDPDSTLKSFVKNHKKAPFGKKTQKKRNIEPIIPSHKIVVEVPSDEIIRYDMGSVSDQNSGIELILVNTDHKSRQVRLSGSCGRIAPGSSWKTQLDADSTATMFVRYFFRNSGSRIHYYLRINDESVTQHFSEIELTGTEVELLEYPYETQVLTATTSTPVTLKANIPLTATTRDIKGVEYDISNQDSNLTVHIDKKITEFPVGQTQYLPVTVKVMKPPLPAYFDITLLTSENRWVRLCKICFKVEEK